MRLHSWLPLVGGLLVAGCGGAGPDAQLVLHHGRVFTGDTLAPWAEAILVRGERIVSVGTNAEVLASADGNAVRIDLGGRTVVPGFNDAHDHIAVPPPGVTVSAVSDPLPDPAFAVVRDSVSGAAARLPAGTWIRVSIGERVLGDPAARRGELDAIAPRHPVALAAWTGHGLILNSAGLRALDLEDSVADPLGGRFDRDRAGQLTGLIEEYASFNTWSAQADTSQASIGAALRGRAEAVVRTGITSIQNMVTGMPLAALLRVADTVSLPVRLRLIRFPHPGPGGRKVTADAEPSRAGAGRVSLLGTKWVLDGTPVERLAVMRSAYTDRPGWHGRLNFPPDTVRALLRESLEANEQVLLHAVGDSTIGLVLSLMDDLAPDSTWQRLRPRIEHGDGVSPDQLELAKRLGVVFVQNPSHLALGNAAASRVGPDRMRVYQPMRTLVAWGIPLALGSDGPLNPFLNLMLAVVHPDNPAEALTVEEAVRAYTWGSAYAEFQETEKGRIGAGMLADLAVLSQDIFTIPPTALPATTSVLTLVGGRVVHDPDGLVPPASD